MLTEAYADGRLDREESDVRSTDIGGARTLGDIPGLLEDLVPTSAVPALVAGGGLMTPREIEERRRLEKKQRKQLEQRSPEDDE